MTQSNQTKRSPRKSTGRWTKTQHQRFMKAFQRYGRDWVNVQKVVKSRTLTQVRSHAQKVFLKLSSQDIDLLIAKQKQYEPLKKIKQSEEQKLNQIQDEISESHNSKSNERKEMSLVNIFMQAIEQQSKGVNQQTQNTCFTQQHPIKRQNDEKMPFNHKKEKQKLEQTRGIQFLEKQSKSFQVFPLTPYAAIFPIEIDLSNQNTTN